MTAVRYAPAGRLSGAREFRSAVATIMVKELRSRMRGRRAFMVLTVYLAVLATIAYGAYTVTLPAVRGFDTFGGMAAVDASARIGQAIFTVLSLFQLLLVCFIAPAFTAGTISLEREKQTLELLISTPLRPGAIVVGKLLAALAFVFLMILAAIPLSALVLMYGGANVNDIIRQQVVLLGTALGLGTVGVFWSVLLKRTQAATVLTYCSMLALTVGTLLLFVFWSAQPWSDGFGAADLPQPAPEQIVYPNPLIAMSDVIANTEIGGYGEFSALINDLRGTARAFGDGAATCDGARCVPPDQVEEPFGVGACAPGGPCPGDVVPGIAVSDHDTLLLGYFWPRFTITFGAIAALLTLVSMWLVVPAGMRVVSRRRRPSAGSQPRALRLPGEDDATIEPIGEPE